MFSKKKKTSALHKPPPPCSAAKLIEMRRKVEEGLVFSCRRQIPMMNFARGAALLLTTPPPFSEHEMDEMDAEYGKKKRPWKGWPPLDFYLCAIFKWWRHLVPRQRARLGCRSFEWDWSYRVHSNLSLRNSYWFFYIFDKMMHLF